MFHTPAHKQADASKQGAQIVNRSFNEMRAEVVAAESYDTMGQVCAYEDGQLDNDEVVVLFQHLIDSGMAWQLQGSYGRQAMRLIDAGHCTAA